MEMVDNLGHCGNPPSTQTLLDPQMQGLDPHMEWSVLGSCSK